MRPCAFGVSLMDDEGNWTLDTPQMHEATEYIDGFFKDGITGTNLDVTPGVSITQFVNGETPIMTGGPTTISQIADQGGDPDSYATAVIPKGVSSTSFVGGADFVVMDEAANPEAGWKFIQWMTEPETQIEWYKTATVLPSSQSAWEDEVLAGDEKLAAYYVYQQFGFGRYGIASAASWVLFIIIAVVSVLQFRILGSDE